MIELLRNNDGTTKYLRFVTWNYLSDRHENVATLLKHTWAYDGKNHDVMDIQAVVGEEYDLTPTQYDELVKEYPNSSDYERINSFFEKKCENEGIVLLSYNQMLNLEKILERKGIKYE